VSNDSICISFDDNSLLPQLFGEDDSNISKIEKFLNVSASYRGNNLSIKGEIENIKAAEAVFNKIYKKLGKAVDVRDGEIEALINSVTGKLSSGEGGNMQKEKTMWEGLVDGLDKVEITTLKKTITPYNEAQAVYIDALLNKEVVFAAGPAGTGKTYIAVAAAVSKFVSGAVDRIILSRPAVEAGEKLGFLPGDMRDKVDPYLRPLYDALYDMLPAERVVKHVENGEIEIAPLAFMRGRTLRNAYVILDEAQNATPVQMKMFLTRLGKDSHMAITGDLSQTDLPTGTKSGFRDALEKLGDIEEVSVANFGDKDIVRHALTMKIVQAYEKHEKD